MEKDINVIVEVEPTEAGLLIGLIEILLKDWYIAKHGREQHLKKIVAAADMGIQVLQPWQDKIKNEIDDIKKLRLEEVEVNFGIVKFKLKRS